MPASKTEDRLYEALRSAISKTSPSERSKLKILREPHVGPFRPDFLFPELGLIVEVEGPHHFSPEASKRDQDRESYFKNNGYNPIRVSAEQVFDDPDSVASYILEVAGTQGYRENSPSVRGGRVANLMLVQFEGGIGFWTEGEDASKWWKLYTQALKEDWLKNGMGETTHESLRWNKYVKGDKTLTARLDYEGVGPEEARRFSQRLLGRRIVDAGTEGNKVIVKIDTS